MNTSSDQRTSTGLLERAHHIVTTTARAWKVVPESAQAHARRAQHGYVPYRVLRRMRTAARTLVAAPAITYAW